MDKIMAREARKRQKDSHDPIILLPEDRMRENAWLGALTYPAALIWYGWTAHFGVFWLVPVSTCPQKCSPDLKCHEHNAGTEIDMH